MGYETAPATKMLATHCLCCGRPLVDATSIETGIGPECRKKHGFVKAQSEPDWSMAAMHCPIDMHEDEDARKLCNRLVYTAACGVDPKVLSRIITTVRLLGFTTLADKLSSRASDAKVSVESGVIIVRTKYNPDFVDESCRVPGRRWDAANKVTTFPESSRREVWAMLQKVFAGGVIDTPKGLVNLV